MPFRKNTLTHVYTYCKLLPITILPLKACSSIAPPPGTDSHWSSEQPAEDNSYFLTLKPL